MHTSDQLVWRKMGYNIQIIPIIGHRDKVK